MQERGRDSTKENSSSLYPARQRQETNSNGPPISEGREYKSKPSAHGNMGRKKTANEVDRRRKTLHQLSLFLIQENCEEIKADAQGRSCGNSNPNPVPVLSKDTQGLEKRDVPTSRHLPAWNVQLLTKISVRSRQEYEGAAGVRKHGNEKSREEPESRRL